MYSIHCIVYIVYTLAWYVYTVNNTQTLKYHKKYIHNYLCIIAYIAYIPTHPQNSFTGLPKVENVTFLNNTVMSNMIWQHISWSTVQLHNDEPIYLIKYKKKRGTALKTARSNANSYTLKVEVPTSKTGLTVWVAAIRNKPPRNEGDFSDPKSITYTSMFCDHYLQCHDTHIDCHTQQHVLHYSSWSTSRPDTCQQNLSQHHIPVVTT